MANKLEGTQIKIDTPTIKKHIGKRARYLLKVDSGIYPRFGTITEIYRKQVDFGSQEWHLLSKISELVILD